MSLQNTLGLSSDKLKKLDDTQLKILTGDPITVIEDEDENGEYLYTMVIFRKATRYGNNIPKKLEQMMDKAYDMFVKDVKKNI